MEITQIYTIVAGGAFALLTIFNFCLHILAFAHRCTGLVLVHIIYPFVLDRHRLIGPWSRAGFLFRLIFIFLNIFCSTFQVKSIADAATRAGNLALINLIPVFFGPHLSFLADLLGISLQTYQGIHGAYAAASVILGTVHTVMSVSERKFSSTMPDQLYGLISICALALLLVSASQYVRKRWFELFLRCHQGCAAAAVYAVWRHIWGKSVFSRYCLYTLSSVFVSTALMQCLVCTYRNFTFRHGFSRASVTSHRNAINIEIRLARPIRVQAGQYVNLWFPRVGFRSLFQSHPFMIVSWREPDTGPMLIQLLAEPRDGFTHRLLRLTNRVGAKAASRHLVFYSGPHGSCVSMKNYGSVLMVATGYGIAALLPHLQELLDAYNRCEVVTRRIHLVWQLMDQGDELAAKDLLDNALRKDSREDGYEILRVSIYYTGTTIDNTEFDGEHGRVAYHAGKLDVQKILEAEMAGEYECYSGGKVETRTGRETGQMVVAVSASENVRDDVRSVVKINVQNQVRYLEMEYQPSS